MTSTHISAIDTDCHHRAQFGNGRSLGFMMFALVMGLCIGCLDTAADSMRVPTDTRLSEDTIERQDLAQHPQRQFIGHEGGELGLEVLQFGTGTLGEKRRKRADATARITLTKSCSFSEEQSARQQDLHIPLTAGQHQNIHKPPNDTVNQAIWLEEDLAVVADFQGWEFFWVGTALRILRQVLEGLVDFLEHMIRLRFAIVLEDMGADVPRVRLRILYKRLLDRPGPADLQRVDPEVCEVFALALTPVSGVLEPEIFCPGQRLPTRDSKILVLSLIFTVLSAGHVMVSTAF